MPSIVFVQQDGITSNYSDRILLKEWQKQENLIRDLHASGFKKNEILKTLADKHSFYPSIGQLNRQLSTWNLKVYKSQRPRRRKNLGFGTPGSHEPLIQQLNTDLPNITQRVSYDGYLFNPTSSREPMSGTAENKIQNPTKSCEEIGKIGEVDPEEVANPTSIPTPETSCSLNSNLTTASTLSTWSPSFPDQTKPITDGWKPASLEGKFDSVLLGKPSERSSISEEISPKISLYELTFSPDLIPQTDRVEGNFPPTQSLPPIPTAENSAGQQHSRHLHPDGRPDSPSLEDTWSNGDNINSYSYQPSTEFLLLWPRSDSNDADPASLKVLEMKNIADYLCASRLYKDAFDLYYLVRECTLRVHNNVASLELESTINCARTCTTPEQCEYALRAAEAMLNWYIEYKSDDEIAMNLLRLYLVDLRRKKTPQDADIFRAEVLRFVLGDDPSRQWATSTFLSREEAAMGMKIHEYQSEITGFRHLSLGSNSTYGYLMLGDIGSSLADRLLEWCITIITKNRKSLDSDLTLPEYGCDEESLEFSAQKLYCCLLESWLGRSWEERSGRMDLSPNTNSFITLGDMHPLSDCEALAAMAFILVKNRAPENVWKKKPFAHLTRACASQRLREAAKTLLGRSSVVGKLFIEAYLARINISFVDRQSPRDWNAKVLLKSFTGSVLKSGLMKKYLQQTFTHQKMYPEHINEDTSSTAVLAGKTGDYRPSSLSDPLSCPLRASTSSSLKAFLETTLNTTRLSIQTITPPSSAMSIDWREYSFSKTTGLPSNPSTTESVQSSLPEDCMDLT